MTRDPIWDEWGKMYELKMREQHGASRIHVDTMRLGPEHINIGDWVMFLPLEITEGASMLPQMAKVLTMQWTPGDVCILTTEQGVLQLRRQDLIEVVA